MMTPYITVFNAFTGIKNQYQLTARRLAIACNSKDFLCPVDFGFTNNYKCPLEKSCSSVSENDWQEWIDSKTAKEGETE